MCHSQVPPINLQLNPNMEPYYQTMPPQPTQYGTPMGTMYSAPVPAQPWVTSASTQLQYHGMSGCTNSSDCGTSIVVLVVLYVYE